VIDGLRRSCRDCRTQREALRYRGRYLPAWEEADVFACYLCGGAFTDEDPLHIEHVGAISRGGLDVPENTRPAHASCNLWKGTRHVFDVVEDLRPGLLGRLASLPVEVLDLTLTGARRSPLLLRGPAKARAYLFLLPLASDRASHPARGPGGLLLPDRHDGGRASRTHAAVALVPMKGAQHMSNAHHTNSNPRARREVPRQARTRGTVRSRPVDPSEVVEGFREGAAAFRRLFESALRQALDEVGWDPSGVMLAHSRAALRSWDFARLDAVDASRVRLDVLRDVCREEGISPLRAGLTREEPEVVEDLEVERTPLRVPRPRPLPDEKVRRSGARH
jgi:hypothetical protein